MMNGKVQALAQAFSDIIEDARPVQKHKRTQNRRVGTFRMRGV